MFYTFNTDNIPHAILFSSKLEDVIMVSVVCHVICIITKRKPSCILSNTMYHNAFLVTDQSGIQHNVV